MLRSKVILAVTGVFCGLALVTAAAMASSVATGGPVQTTTDDALPAPILISMVDLSFVPDEDPVPAGSVVAVELIATSQPGQTQDVAAMDVIVHWDPAVLQFNGLDATGAFPWGTASGFLPDTDGINLSTSDGDAIYSALAAPGVPATVTDAGLLVTTFLFTALQPAALTDVQIVAQQGMFGSTKVLAPSPPQTHVLGSFSGADLMVVFGGPCVCGDLDSTSTPVDLDDFAIFADCLGRLPSESQECTCSNFHWDHIIDLADYQVFSNLFDTQSANMVPDCP
jgi:hypothetical protein